MVLSNAERQARYRKRLKEAASVSPEELEALRKQSAALSLSMPALRKAAKALPDGPDKEAALAHLDELEEARRKLAALRKVLRDTKNGGGAVPDYAKGKSLSELAAKPTKQV